MTRPATARINLTRLRRNYRLLTERAGSAAIMAIVKADAYGHGLDLIAPALLDAGCRSFGVTDACEGARLRRLLGAESAEITPLSGLFDHKDAQLALSEQLTPAVTSPTELARLQAAGFRGSVWIKIDSGMNRLGAADPAALISRCRACGIGIRGIMSHLACADTPAHPLNRQQASRFSALRQAAGAEQLPASLLNSAGLIAMPDQRLDVARPGIALYGSEPVADQPIGVEPVMTLTGAVMQICDIPVGAQISYGAAFTATRNMRIAVVALGYADGVPRALSNRGHVWFGGVRLPVVGRVCMDYTIIDVTDSEICPGDAVEFWGQHIRADDLARVLDTISYTLFTGVGARVRRIAEYSG